LRYIAKLPKSVRLRKRDEKMLICLMLPQTSVEQV
jgi:hypothetical protein